VEDLHLGGSIRVEKLLQLFSIDQCHPCQRQRRFFLLLNQSLRSVEQGKSVAGLQEQADDDLRASYHLREP
jgi:hypothetical protein